jgi:hypothetical protein
VRSLLRDEDERSGRTVAQLVVELHAEVSFEGVQDFVRFLVEVQRGSFSRRGDALERRQRSVGLGTADLERQRFAEGVLDGGTFARPEEEARVLCPWS